MSTVCFDLDGTLCTTTGGAYDRAEPFDWAIARVNRLAAAGHRILIFTARGTATGIDWRPTTEAQLARWGVDYDELILGKPSADVFIDDRAVHADTWRLGEGLRPPGLPLQGAEAAGLWADPAVAAPAPVSVVEIGRTFGGLVKRLDQHAARVSAMASAAGLTGLPSPDAIAAAVCDRLEDEARSDDIVFTIRLSGAPHSSLVHSWTERPAALLAVECRPLQEALRCLGPILVPGPALSAHASLAGGDGSGWPLAPSPSETVAAGLGSRLCVVAGGRALLEPAGAAPDVAGRWLGEIAARAGVAVEQAPLRQEALQRADEAFIVGLPFCLLAIASIGSLTLTAPGPVTRRLQAGWSEDAGIDIAAQAAQIRRSPVAGAAVTRMVRERNEAVVVIPARLQSSRLARKVLTDLDGRTMIEHVHDVAVRSRVGPVIVLTDADEVADVVRGFGGEVWMTESHHESGTARIASVVERLDSTIVVNLQGDAPLTDPEVVAQAARTALSSRAPVTMPVYRLPDEAAALDPSVVKVVRRSDGSVLYCSRSVIPFRRDPAGIQVRDAPFWGHAGLYAYSTGFLRTFDTLAASALEDAERLEQLRWLEAGVAIHSFVIEPQPPSVDTAADLQEVRRLLGRRVPSL